MRVDLGVPVVAVRIRGTTVVVLADHQASDEMINAATRAAQVYTDPNARDGL